MNDQLPRRLAHRLPAYHSGRLSRRERGWVERQLERSPAWRAESEQIARLVSLLLEQDPAGPPDERAVARLLPLLRAEMAAQRPRSQPAWLRPMPAMAAAGLLFACGLLTGAQAFPRTIDRRVTVEVEKRVEVPVEVVKRVEVPVERVVRVPVERVVTRWRTRTVLAAKPAPPRAANTEPRPDPPAATVVQVPTEPGPVVAPGAVPVSVQF